MTERKNLKNIIIIIFFVYIAIAFFSVVCMKFFLSDDTSKKKNNFEISNKNHKKEQSSNSNNITDESKNDILSQFETISVSDINRDNNLELACEALNGKVIQAKSQMSFNDCVGPCTEKDGYLEAPIIVNKTKLGKGIGGGVCQVSTTLYNTALLANFDIVERHPHSFAVDYVQVGRDSAIDYNNMDLVIKNPYDKDIIIKASSQDGRVSISFCGMKFDKEVAIKVESIVVEEIKPEGEQIQFTNTLPPGQREVIQYEHMGYKTCLYRKYFKKNKLISTVMLAEDSYPAISKMVMEGASTRNK